MQKLISPRMPNPRSMRALRRSNTTGYVGVSYDPWRRKYRASIRINGRMKQLGYYYSPIEAAQTYDAAARAAGLLDRLNFQAI